LEQYLHKAAKDEDRAWPVDMTTLLRELDSAGHIRTHVEKNGRLHREVLKKIKGKAERYLWLKCTALEEAGEEPPEEQPNEDTSVPVEPERYPELQEDADDIPF
jgi:hypothetical protein